MIKVLIYKSISDLKPAGGPAGYLYNLKEVLDNIDKKDLQIDFLPEKKAQGKSIKKYVPKIILSFLRAYKYTKLKNKKVELPDEYLNYDVIHFHQTTDLYYCRDFFKKYNGKVVLTSHSPCAYHVELINNLKKIYRNVFKKKLKQLEDIDEYAFNRADYVIFPCKEAEEPYYNSWEKYKDIRDKMKVKYLFTGIKNCVSEYDSKYIRKKYGYSNDDFIISYVGRHNEIKGYDNFIKLGLSAINQLDVKVLVGGVNAPLKGPNNKSWKEIGWTNMPYSIINCCDIFVLPNKETYFDLVMLEVLSLGKIVLTTYTGGNKIFKDFKNIGVFYYNDSTDFIEKIKYIKNLPLEKIKKYEENNQNIFKENFSNNIFGKKYIEIIKEVVK